MKRERFIRKPVNNILQFTTVSEETMYNFHDTYVYELPVEGKYQSQVLV